MFGGPNYFPAYVCPVDALIEGLIDQPNNTDVVASNNVQTEGNFLTGLIILNGTDYPLNSAFQYLQHVAFSMYACEQLAG